MIQGILHLKIDPNQKYQQQCITITFLHLTRFWGDSSRLCTLDGLTLQDMAHTFGFVMARWDAAWSSHYLRGTETAPPSPSCQNIRSVCEPRGPQGPTSARLWPALEGSCTKQGGHRPLMPPVAVGEDHSLGTPHIRTGMLPHGPVTTVGDPRTRRGPYSGQCPAPSPPTLSVLWCGALLHYPSLSVDFCAFIANLMI